MLQQMNRQSADRWNHDPEFEARIQAFELAFRMQTEAPEAFDISKGIGSHEETVRPRSSGNARFRLAVPDGAPPGAAQREIHPDLARVGPGNEVGWDAHSELIRLHTRTALQVDQPIHGLLTDLKAHGLLEDTLVVWGGEFGRTPIAQAGDGRDHNPYGYTMWMAGGGVKGGMTYGATDDYGYFAVEDRMHIHDLHATILHISGHGS